MASKISNQITFTEQKKIIEIQEWYLATSADSGITTDPSLGWTQAVQIINNEKKYLWNYEKVIYSIGDPEVSSPVIIGFYGQGTAGKGISTIENYYQTTQNLTPPSLPTENEASSWTNIDDAVKNLSPTNRYLWNYEAIIYTDNTVTLTEPAVIGVYGDSGKDAVTFDIYSLQGFQFTEDIDEIELKTSAFRGSNKISNATYSWYWNSIISGSSDEWNLIEAATESSLIVNVSSEYALSNLKCVMTLKDGSQYEDYVMLSYENAFYTSEVKFLGGSNIFTASDLFLIARVELYKNGHQVEDVLTNQYCTGVVSIDNDGTINTTVSGKFKDEDKMYFVYMDGRNYKHALGKCTVTVDESSGEPIEKYKWTKIDEELKYSYGNSLYEEMSSNIIVISKESVNKSVSVEFEVKNNDVVISTTRAMVIDSNDPIISATEPLNPVLGQWWLNTTTGILMVCTQTEPDSENADVPVWKQCFSQTGVTIFTSRPQSYKEGDLWILGDGEACGKYTVEVTVENDEGNEEIRQEDRYTFGPGSMVKSIDTSNTFDDSHWVDADAETTDFKNNIKQYFGFDTDNGLRIGQTDDAFYVNISAKEMGFYEKTEDGPDQKVVAINNQSAFIKDLNAQGNAKFDSNATIEGNLEVNGDFQIGGKFAWQLEDDDSLSLVVVNS